MPKRKRPYEFYELDDVLEKMRKDFPNLPLIMLRCDGGLGFGYSIHAKCHSLLKSLSPSFYRSLRLLDDLFDSIRSITDAVSHYEFIWRDYDRENESKSIDLPELDQKDKKKLRTRLSKMDEILTGLLRQQGLDSGGEESSDEEVRSQATNYE